jgi:long-subunit fatty acid transport protein
MQSRAAAHLEPPPARAAGACALLLLALAPAARGQDPLGDTDRLAITGRQNLTIGSGARAYGMGGAFLARADDATAASWNPAGLSYLRSPEVSVVGVYNNFDTSITNATGDSFEGGSLDFAAFAWPIGAGEVRGAVQLSYQRAVSFDGTRHIDQYGDVVDENNQTTNTLIFKDDGVSDGGFDVIAFGTGLRLSRRLRAGLTINRWFNGYEQNLVRNYERITDRPRREFDLDFRPDGWSFNFGLIVSPVENLNLGATYRTRFTAGVGVDKARRDFWGSAEQPDEITSNAYSSGNVRLDFPDSFGFGVSWRPRDRLTLSADYTRTGWASSTIRDYFELGATPPSDDNGNPSPQRPPRFLSERQYPTLSAVPEQGNPSDPARLTAQQDAEQIRAGVEYVLIHGQFKVPLRAGYFNDRQIIPAPDGHSPRFNGLTVGTGIIVGPMQLDLAYVYEFGEYFVAAETGTVTATAPVPAAAPASEIRYALTTNRVYASLIYRFRGRWLP